MEVRRHPTPVPVWLGLTQPAFPRGVVRVDDHHLRSALIG
jgi:hypothetical protein